MATFRAYCSLDFLDRFYSEHMPEDRLAARDQDECWHSLHRFLVREADIVIAHDDDDLQSLVDAQPYLKYFLNGVQRPDGARVHFDAKAADEVVQGKGLPTSDYPWQVHLIEEASKASRLASRGVLAFDATTALDRWKWLGHTHRMNVSPSQDNSAAFKAWQDMRRYAAPLNAIVVSDRYMLKTKERTLQNVASLLVELLPTEKNEVPVDITLIAGDPDNDLTGAVYDRDNPERMHRDICQRIKQKRPCVEVNLCIVLPLKKHSETHDRQIFLNYGTFSSGNSFSGYTEDGSIKTNTTLDYWPKTRAEFLSIAFDKLKGLAMLVEKTPRAFLKGKPAERICIVGDKNNRLLRAATNR